MKRLNWGAAALGLALAACSHGPKQAARPAGTATVAVAASEVDAILQLLDQGEEKAAKKRIATGLKSDPMNPSLLVLRDSIERDPKELLGPESFAYTVRPGETMSGLAQRFLGNKLKAYQLARYNDVEKPVDLAAGRELRIPGQAPRVEQPRAEQPAAKPARRPEAVAKPAPAKPKPVAAKPAPAPAAAAPVANAAGARQARAAGLAALNQGQVGRALGLLRRAQSMDPGNPVIARDVQRAERIASTVRARR